MARIHKGRGDPRRLLRRARLLTALCWPLAVAALLLTGLFLWQCGERLLALATAWRESFTAWAVAPGAGKVFPETWMNALWQVAEVLLRGVGWTIWGLTLALPPLLGLALAALMIRLFRPALRQYRQVRAEVSAVRTAMKLLAPMPDSCHIFLYPRIVFEGQVSQPQMVLVSPGGVAVLGVNGLSGLMEGCVTDTVLIRRYGEDEVEKLRNPVRPVVANVTRLSNYLASQGVSVWVIPCVAFVHPEASAYVHLPDAQPGNGRRTRVSSCVVTDAASFWEDIGRRMASGRTLPQKTVDQIVLAIRRARKKRKPQ